MQTAAGGPPPPGSPPLVAPPIKKQRGDDSTAQSRSAALRALQTDYRTRRNLGPPRRTMPQVGLGFHPPAARTSTATASNNNGFRQPPPRKAHSAPSATAPAAASASGTTTSTSANDSAPPTTTAQPPPPVPSRQANNYTRQSDIFPHAPKATTPAVARRLAFAEHATPAAPSQKGVTFAATPEKDADSPEPVVSPPQEGPPTTAASATPYSKAAAALHAGHTPFPGQADSAGSKSQKLAAMRQMADTPPAKSVVTFAPTPPPEAESVELRMQRQWTAATQKNAALYETVAALQDELTERTVSQSPRMPTPQPADKVLTPPRRRPPTPHPKQTAHIAPQFLEQAVAAVAYKFESDDDDADAPAATFVIRRPFGAAAQDRALWFAAGQAPAKVYAQQASVHDASSLEVAVQMAADDSTLLVYDRATVRHQNTAQGVWHTYGEFDESTALGKVAYIDTDATEREYSLDDLVVQALEVRKHYCA